MTEHFDIEGYDASSLYSSELDSWMDLYQRDVSIFQNLVNIISETVLLENPDIQIPVAAIYLMQSSKLAQKLPIMYCYGCKGSGKTTLATLATLLRGRKSLLTPADTFASVRNTLNEMTWYDPEEKTTERDGVLICWDNLWSWVLKQDAKIYSTLLMGYDRSTSWISIAAEGGKNLRFQTFGPKIISSVDNFLDGNFLELERRILPVFHDSIEGLARSKEYSKEQCDNFVMNKIEIESFDWNGFSDVFFSLWHDREAIRNYVLHRKALTRRNSKFRRLWTSSAEFWTISVDLICTGIAIGAFEELEQGIEFFCRYWAWTLEKRQQVRGNFVALLTELVEELIGSKLESAKLLKESGYEPDAIYIDSARINAAIGEWGKRGLLERKIHKSDIASVMGSMNFSLTTKGWKIEC